MKVIILGTNRAEVNEIKAKDFDKHFFQRRKQGYRIFPDGLTRMKIYNNGVWVGDDEVIVYPENGIEPHLTRGLDYSPLALKTDIDMHKNATTDSFFNKFKMWATVSGSIWKGIAPYIGVIIAGGIVAWAFLT